MADSGLKLKPLGDRLVVKPATREETTASGIVLPDTAKEKPQRGTIVAAAGRTEAGGAAGSGFQFARCGRLGTRGPAVFANCRVSWNGAMWRAGPPFRHQHGEPGPRQRHRVGERLAAGGRDPL